MSYNSRPASSVCTTPSLSRTGSSGLLSPADHSFSSAPTTAAQGTTGRTQPQSIIAPSANSSMFINVPAKHSILRAASDFITKPARVINPDTVHEQRLHRSYIVAGVSRDMYRKVISRIPLLDVLAVHSQAPTGSALLDAPPKLKQLVAQEFARLKNGEIINLRDESDSLLPAVAAAAAASATSPEAVKSLLLNPLSHIMISYLIEEQRFDEAIKMARTLYVTRASQNRGVVILRLVQYSDLLRKVAFMVDRKTTLRTHSTVVTSSQEMLRSAVSYLEEATKIRKQLAETADREFSLYAQQQQQPRQQQQQQHESTSTAQQRRQPPLLTAGTSAASSSANRRQQQQTQQQPTQQQQRPALPRMLALDPKERYAILANSYIDSAYLIDKLDKKPEAMQLLELALPILRERVYPGRPHEAVATCLHNIGVLADTHLCDRQLATARLEEAIKIRNQLYDELNILHENLADSIFALGTCLEREGKRFAGGRMQLDAANKYRALFLESDGSPKVAACLTTVAVCIERLGDPLTASKLCAEACSMIDKLFPAMEVNEVKAMIYDVLGGMLEHLGNFYKGLFLKLVSLDQRRRIFGGHAIANATTTTSTTGHSNNNSRKPEVVVEIGKTELAASLSSVAGALEKLGFYDRALEMRLESLHLYNRRYTSDIAARVQQQPGASARPSVADQQIAQGLVSCLIGLAKAYTSRANIELRNRGHQNGTRKSHELSDLAIGHAQRAVDLCTAMFAPPASGAKDNILFASALLCLGQAMQTCRADNNNNKKRDRTAAANIRYQGLCRMYDSLNMRLRLFGKQDSVHLVEAASAIVGCSELAEDADIQNFTKQYSDVGMLQRVIASCGGVCLHSKAEWLLSFASGLERIFKRDLQRVRETQQANVVTSLESNRQRDSIPVRDVHGAFVTEDVDPLEQQIHRLYRGAAEATAAWNQVRVKVLTELKGDLARIAGLGEEMVKSEYRERTPDVDLDWNFVWQKTLPQFVMAKKLTEEQKQEEWKKLAEGLMRGRNDSNSNNNDPNAAASSSGELNGNNDNNNEQTNSNSGVFHQQQRQHTAQPPHGHNDDDDDDDNGILDETQSDGTRVHRPNINANDNSQTLPTRQESSSIASPNNNTRGGGDGGDSAGNMSALRPYDANRVAATRRVSDRAAFQQEGGIHGNVDTVLDIEDDELLDGTHAGSINASSNSTTVLGARDGQRDPNSPTHRPAQHPAFVAPPQAPLASPAETPRESDSTIPHHAVFALGAPAFQSQQQQQKNNNDDVTDAALALSGVGTRGGTTSVSAGLSRVSNAGTAANSSLVVHEDGDAVSLNDDVVLPLDHDPGGGAPDSEEGEEKT